MFLKHSKNLSQTLCNCRKKNLVRNIGNHTANNFQEVEIEVPWGKICGKYWGPLDVQPIIAIHGRRDNACSFDPLAVRLPENVSLFALDLPGHGLSSWFPRGFEYTALTSVHVLYRVKEYFEIDKLKLMGHSLGGVISFMYSCINPNGVKYVITFENYKPLLFRSTRLPLAHKYNETFISNEKTFKPKTNYTYEKAIKKIIKISRSSLNLASSEVLIDRGMTRQRDGTLCFNEDPRVKFFPLDVTASSDYAKMLAKKILCPFMFIKSHRFDQVDRVKHYYDALKVIKETSSDLQYYSVPGTHHFHMNNSEQVANIINPFILKHAN